MSGDPFFSKCSLYCFLFILSLFDSFSFCQSVYSLVYLNQTQLLLCSIELSNDDEFVEKFNLDDQDLGPFLHWVSHAQCQASKKFVDIRRWKVRHHDEREIGKGQLLSMFQACFPVELKEMGTEEVRLVLRPVIGMAFLCQNDELVVQMFRRIFVNNNLSVGYVNGRRYKQKIFELRANKTYVPAKAISQTSPFEMQLYFHALIFLEACR